MLNSKKKLKKFTTVDELGNMLFVSNPSLSVHTNSPEHCQQVQVTTTHSNSELIGPPSELSAAD
jgi:hypothetical protein